MREGNRSQPPGARRSRSTTRKEAPGSIDSAVLEPGYAGLLTLAEAKLIRERLLESASLRRRWAVEKQKSYALTMVAAKAFPENPRAAREHLRRLCAKPKAPPQSKASGPSAAQSRGQPPHQAPAHPRGRTKVGRQTATPRPERAAPLPPGRGEAISPKQPGRIVPVEVNGIAGARPAARKPSASRIPPPPAGVRPPASGPGQRPRPQRPRGKASTSAS